MAGLAGRRASAALLSIAVACALPSTDEFASGKLAFPGPDAAAEGGAIDQPRDGGPDGGASGTETGASTCPPSALFCDDFEGVSLTGKWGRTEDDEGLLVSAEGVQGRGLGVNLGARDGSKRLTAFIEQEIDLAAGKPFTVSFDLDVSAVQDVGLVGIGCFRFHGPYLNVGLRIADYGTGGLVLWYGDPIGSGEALYEEVKVEPLPANRWVRVGCTMTYPNGAPNLRVTYDGRQIFESKIPVEAYVGKPYVAAGVTTTEKSGLAMTVRVDNLVVTSP
ncbi:MAG: hypothetical protein U0270_33005 [Labilithrix sp.]